MARAIWTGSLSFGLVNVPVGLYSATQEHEVRFHQFERGTSDRVRNKRVNERTGDEVDYDDIVKGADIGDGKYVIVTPEELDSVEPGKSRTIDISDFVDAADIDPVYFQKSYYLAPTDEPAKKAYALLMAAMQKADKFAIATFVMRDKQYLAAVRPADGVLVLSTMFFADEVRNPRKELDNLPAKSAARGKDVNMAVDLIESMTSKWDPKNYRDTYTDRVEKLVKAKKNDREVVTEREPEPTSEKVVDLLAALQASLDQSKGHKPGNTHNVAALRTRKAADDDDEAEGRKTAAKTTSQKSTKKSTSSTRKKSSGKTSPKKTAKRSSRKRATSKAS